MSTSTTFSNRFTLAKNWDTETLINFLRDLNIRMVPQISNCGIIAIYGIAEHCGFLNLNIRNSAIRNCPQFRKYSAIPQSTAIQLRNNCGIAAHLRNCDTFAELQFR